MPKTKTPISFLQADMEMDGLGLREVFRAVCGVCRRKRAGRGNGDDLASMAGRRSICWTVCFPRLPCSTASAARPTNTSDPSMTLNPKSHPTLLTWAHCIEYLIPAPSMLWCYPVLGNTSQKKNVFFRALPELPLPLFRATCTSFSAVKDEYIYCIF